MKSLRGQRGWRATLVARIALAVELLALLSGCGGGGGELPPGPPPGPAVLTILTTSLPDGITNVAYNQTLAASGGTGTRTWSLASGSGPLPTGLTLSSAGVISGNPTTPGTYNFTVQVVDSGVPQQTATRALSIRIGDPLLITTTSPLPTGTAGVAYNQTIAASGGIGNRAWNVSLGSVPPGLALNSTATNATLTGTPTTSGTFSFTVQVVDSSLPQQVATRAFLLTINPGPPVITTTTLQTGAVGAAYNATIQAAGGTLPFAWSEPTGSFDAGGVGTAATPCEGLTLNVGATGTSTTISGTPVNLGTCGPFTIQVNDSAAQSDTQSLSILINAAPTGRNDCLPPAIGGTCNGPTPLVTGGGLTITASISPYADPPAGPANPDTDYYEIMAPGGTTVTIETFAQRTPINGGMDSVIEIVNASGTRFPTCRTPANPAGPFNESCLNDDIIFGVLLDSRLEFQVPVGPVLTFYVHVLDWRGDARPDLRYQMTITGAN